MSVRPAWRTVAKVSLGGGRIDVEGDDPLARVGRDPAEATGVRAEVPHTSSRQLAHEPVDKAVLVRRRPLAVARVLGIVSPLRPACVPVERSDGRAQVPDHPLQAGPRDAGATRRTSIVVCFAA